MNKKRKNIIRLVSFIMVLFIMASPIITHAGNEADYPHCDSMKSWAKYYTQTQYGDWCIWSACRSLGLSKTQSAALCAIAYHESGSISWRVENDGHRLGNPNYTDKDGNELNIPTKNGAFNPSGVMGRKKKITYYNDYVKYIAKPYTKEHNQISREVLICGYGGESDPEADSAAKDIVDAAVVDDDELDKDGNEYKITRSGKSDIAVTGYIAEHSYYCGIGYVQFTGERAASLLLYAKGKKKDWWDPSTQLTWMFTDEEKGGDSNKYISSGAYLSETKDCTIEECICKLQYHYIGNAYDGASWDAIDSATEKSILQKANLLLGEDRFMNRDWDIAFGNEIVTNSGHKPATMRTGIDDKTILGELGNPTVLLSVNSGFLINEDYEKTMTSKNEEVYKDYISTRKGNGSTSQKYSLYELYGEDIHWYRYLGEITMNPELVDHIYSAVEQKRTKLLKSPTTVFYEPTNYLSCNVYNGRPVVLSSSDEGTDPRNITMLGGFFNGYHYILGCLDMAAAKYIVAFFSLLCGPALMELIFDVLTFVETSEVWDVVGPVVILILAFATMAFIVSLVKLGIKYSKGNSSMKEVLTRFFVGFICFGLAFCSVARPTIFNDLILKGVTCIDQIFNYSLQQTIKDDDVICVSDPDMATSAALWKTAIFGPWCRGQFNGLEYDELYTNYAENLDKGQSAMPQSNEEADPINPSEEPYFNSTLLTGDVTVPVGGGYELRNWAAYLYSCGSVYHIDHSLSEMNLDDIDENDLEINFPTCNTTARNKEINADLFRVIDAQMDISPQYYQDGKVIRNYTNSHVLHNKYLFEGLIMLFNTLCLGIMIPVLIKKLISFIMLLVTVIKLIFYTIKELFKPGEGLKEFGDSVKKHATDYFVSSLKLTIMLTFYMLFIDQGMLKLFIYIVLCLVVLGFNIKDARYLGSNIANSVRRATNKL